MIKIEGSSITTNQLFLAKGTVVFWIPEVSILEAHLPRRSVEFYWKISEWNETIMP